MSWEDTTREFIKLTSPSGSIYQAYWRANDRTFEKKLGIFSMPRFKGDIVQDLGVTSVKYPLNVFFQGENQQEQSEDFFTDLYNDEGQWEVVHPIKGTIALQLVSCGEAVSGVEPNTTEISTDWIEPANVDIILSAEELFIKTEAAIAQTKFDALASLAKLRTDSYAAIQSSINTFQKVAGFARKVFDELVATVALIQDSFDSAISAFTASLALYGIGNTDPEDVGNDTIDIITIPAGANDDYSSRFNIYNNYITNNFTLTPETVTEDDININLTVEFSTIVSLATISDIIISSEFKSRTEIIAAINAVTDLFNNTVKALDEIQDLFSTLDIDDQFFSNIDTYTSLMKMFESTIRYLMTQFYNLSAEKKITLKNDRSPIEITVTEYGSLGENDSNLDLFLESNNLELDEILLLPAGKEVVIYV